MIKEQLDAGGEYRSHVRDRAEQILDRYPEIEEEEAQELVTFLRKGDPLQAALLTTKQELRPKLEAFREERPQDFGLTGKHYLAVTLIVLGLFALCWFLWDIAAGT